jgi:hypothetical protein
MRARSGILLATLLVVLTLTPWALKESIASDASVRQIISTGGPGSTSPLIDDNLIILEVRLDKLVLDQGMLAYIDNGRILMPLGELVDDLELAIDVDARNGYASGWILHEHRRFQLDLANRTVLSDAGQAAVPVDRVFADEFDIYVDADLLSDWLPVTILTRTVNLYAEVITEEVMPIQTRLKRQQTRDRLLFSADRQQQNFPLFKAEYRPFTWPLIDAQFEMRSRDSEITPRFSMQSTGDMAHMTTRTFYTHDPGAEHPNTARLRVGRSDVDAELLGPLGATIYELGDIYSAGTPLLLRGAAGRGLRLSNQAVYKSATYNTTLIQGDAPPGWEVELQHNSTLLDFTTVDESGTYVFEDVPLRVGENNFLIKLYGPQGQKREEHQTITTGADMLGKGNISYQFDVVQDKHHLFYNMADPLSEPDFGAWTTHGAVGYGLSDNIFLQNSLTRVSVDGRYRTYDALTTGTNVRGYFLRSVLAHEMDKGNAGQFSLMGNIKGRSLQLEHSRFGDYSSEVNDQSTKIAVATRLGLGGNTRLRHSPLAYDLNLHSTSYDSRSINRTHRAELRLATNYNQYALATRFDFRHHSTVNGGYTQFTGDQLASTWLGPLLMRGQIRYEMAPDPQVQSVSASASWRPLTKLRLSSRIQHNIADHNQTNLQTSLSLVLDKFNVGLNSSLASGESGFVSLMVTTALTGEPNSRRLHVQRNRLSNSFGAQARVFLDRNANGIYDTQDDPLSGVGISGNSAWQDRQTNADGLIFLTGLPAYRGRNIKINTETLSDPFMISSQNGIKVTGHPGGIADVEFPITFSGDIEGTVYGESIAGKIPLRNITLELVALKDYSVITTMSEFDGYYIFQEIPPGWYEVRVAEESLTRKQFNAPAPVSVPIAAEGGTQTGVDFLLRYSEIHQTSR